MKKTIVRSLLAALLLFTFAALPMMAEASKPIIVIIWGHRPWPCHGLGPCYIFVPDPGPQCPIVEVTIDITSDTHLVLTALNPPSQQGDDNNFEVDENWPVPNPELYGYKSLTVLKGNYPFDWTTKQVTLKYQGERDPNTLFSNLGASNNSYNRADGYRVSGANTQGNASFSSASQFQPINSGEVSQIDLGVSYVSGLNSFNVALYTDNNGLPGTALGQWNNLSSSANYGTCCGMVSVTGITGVSLTAGTNYWLVVGPTDQRSTTWEMWNVNTVRLKGGVLYSNDGGQSWNGSSSDLLGAFDIIGSSGSGSAKR